MDVEIRELSHGSPEYQAEVALRLRVLREPLGLTFTGEQLATEAADVHLCAFCAGRLVGCLVLTPVAVGIVQMRQVAVEPSMQGQGVGTALVDASEQVARERGFIEMMMHARVTAVPFYERLGYSKRGHEFEEVTIPHWEMAKALGSAKSE
jgi:N-acetylglutamate synthase-like GNAT family acetyltransferase